MVLRLVRPSCRLADDHVPGSFSVLGEQMRHIGKTRKQKGFDAGFHNLYFTGEHNNAENHLKERGRHTSNATFPDLFAKARISLPLVDFGSGVNGVVDVTAIRK